jgi:hypothetical protein
MELWRVIKPARRPRAEGALTEVVAVGFFPGLLRRGKMKRKGFGVLCGGMGLGSAIAAIFDSQSAAGAIEHGHGSSTTKTSEATKTW